MDTVSAVELLYAVTLKARPTPYSPTFRQTTCERGANITTAR